MVIWHVSSGGKEFLPRLGAPIVHIAINSKPGAEEFLLSLANGSYIFVDACTLTLSRACFGMRMGTPVFFDKPSDFCHAFTMTRRGTISIPFASHSPSSTLLLPSSDPSLIQIYSVANSAFMSSVEIVPYNRVSRRDNKPLEISRVSIVSVSDAGEWIATVDGKEGENKHDSNVQLKFWRWSSSTWSLNTRIYQPHSSARTIAISFSPDTASSLMLATAGLDGTVKVWCLRRDFKHRNVIAGNSISSLDRKVQNLTFYRLLGV